MMAWERPLYGPERMREAHASPGTRGAGMRFRFGGGGASPYQIHRLSRVTRVLRNFFLSRGYNISRQYTVLSKITFIFTATISQ